MQLDLFGGLAKASPWRRKSTLLWVLLAYSGLIFLISSQSSLSIQSEPMFPNQDKVEHILAYGVMAFMAWMALRQWTILRRCWLWAWVYAVGYGISDEWHQLFVPGRYADVWDLAADALGAALAILLLETLRARQQSRGAGNALASRVRYSTT